MSLPSGVARHAQPLTFLQTLASLLTALYYAVFAAANRSFFGMLWPAALCLAEFVVSGYLRSFWAKEKKVPLMDEYNESIDHTMTVMRLSGALAYFWGAIVAVKALGY